MKYCYFLLIVMNFTLIAAQSYIGGSTYGLNGMTTVSENFQNSDGDLFVVGLYNSDFDFAGETHSFVNGNADAYLVKYDASGTEIFAKTFTGNADNAASAGTVDANGNIYLTGYFQGAGTNSFDADPGPNQFLLANTSAINNRDCFIIKLDSNGDFLWAKQLTNNIGAAPEDSYDMEVDSEGNVYVVGRFVYADFDPDPGNEFILQSASNSLEGFVLKLDTNGDFQWVQHIKNAENIATCITLDDNENPVVGGHFYGSIQVDDASTSVNLNSNGSRDVYIISFNKSDGSILNSTSFGGTENVFITSLIKTNQGIAYAGHFEGTASLDPSNLQTFTASGTQDAYVVQLNQINFSANHYILGQTGMQSITDLLQDDQDQLLVAGKFEGMVNFDYPNATEAETAAGTSDGFVLVIGADNSYLSHYIISSSDKAINTHIETSGNTIYVNGWFNQQVDLDPFSGSDTYTTIASYATYLSMFEYQNLNLEDIQSLSNITIYPNPAKDYIHLSDSQYQDYEIYNWEGKLIRKGTISENSNINILSLPKGNYILQLNGEEKPLTKSFIKN